MISFVSLSSLLAVSLALPHSTILNPCKVQHLNDRDVFQFRSGGKLVIEVNLVEDNRPCQIEVTRPGEDNPVILKINKEEKDSKDGITARLTKIYKNFRIVKLILSQNNGKSLRGKYDINGLTIFGFPLTPADVKLSQVEDVSCNNREVKGRIDLSPDFHLCCEYHRSKNSTSSPILGQCCNSCLDYQDGLEVAIHYRENTMDFSFAAGYETNPVEVACVIKSEGLHMYKVKFQTVSPKAKC